MADKNHDIPLPKGLGNKAAHILTGGDKETTVSGMLQDAFISGIGLGHSDRAGLGVFGVGALSVLTFMFTAMNNESHYIANPQELVSGEAVLAYGMNTPRGYHAIQPAAEEPAYVLVHDNAIGQYALYQTAQTDHGHSMQYIESPMRAWDIIGDIAHSLSTLNTAIERQDTLSQGIPSFVQFEQIGGFTPDDNDHPLSRIIKNFQSADSAPASMSAEINAAFNHWSQAAMAVSSGHYGLSVEETQETIETNEISPTWQAAKDGASNTGRLIGGYLGLVLLLGGVNFIGRVSDARNGRPQRNGLIRQPQRNT